jgi:hypothetical protein
MKNKLVAREASSQERTPFKDQTNIQAEPNHDGISSVLFNICHDKPCC